MATKFNRAIESEEILAELMEEANEVVNDGKPIGDVSVVADAVKDSRLTEAQIAAVFSQELSSLRKM